MALSARVTLRATHESCVRANRDHLVCADGYCVFCGLSRAVITELQTKCAVCATELGNPNFKVVGEAGAFCSMTCAVTRSALARGPLEPWEEPDAAPNLTALGAALHVVFETFNELACEAHAYWRTDFAVIAAVHARADFRMPVRRPDGRSVLEVSTGRQERAFVIAWREDLLGARTRWLEHTFRARTR